MVKHHRSVHRHTLLGSMAMYVKMIHGPVVWTTSTLVIVIKARVSSLLSRTTRLTPTTLSVFITTHIPILDAEVCPPESQHKLDAASEDT